MLGYDCVFVINLAHRSDRRREIARQMVDDYELFSAYSPPDAGMFLSPGANGCFLSHRAILNRAAEGNASVLIIEDDCDFTQAARSYVIPDGTDIFYGGYEAMDQGPLDQSRIIGSHLMGFSERAAKVASDYLSNFDQPDFTPDAQAVTEESYNPSIRPGIDGAYVWLRRRYPDLVTHFAVPPIAYQRRSRSDVTAPRFYDRIPGLRAAVGLARRFA